MYICETFRSCPVRYGTLHGPLLLTLPHPDSVPRVPATSTPITLHSPITHASTARTSPAAHPPRSCPRQPHTTHTFSASTNSCLYTKETVTRPATPHLPSPAAKIPWHLSESMLSAALSRLRWNGTFGTSGRRAEGSPGTVTWPRHT